MKYVDKDKNDKCFNWCKCIPTPNKSFRNKICIKGGGL